MIIKLKNEVFEDNYFNNAIKKLFMYEGTIVEAKLINSLREKVLNLFDIYMEKKNILLNKYGEKVENNKFRIKEESRNEWREEWGKLLEQEQEVFVDKKIPATINIKLSSLEYQAIKDFLEG